ncbi:hypothetical protein KC622_01935 [Candidatus Dojkabacteria bacterium]|uniref:DUF7768 domain-containing protein n=1 Tax=Candidatus Dojkabacteria bacterium TaxID=2099670 RepID=A0A955HXY9_9BACT|nr:hypothetical protein [Candidatus Dojkabacteria bacterium]MCB9791039.1 hypothetical protein [Candidatus Nomurabacteria bacterium]
MSYLVSAKYLQDHIQEEWGTVNTEHLLRKVMDEVWLCGDKISMGMKEEIKLALKYQIPVVCYN